MCLGQDSESRQRIANRECYRWRSLPEVVETVLKMIVFLLSQEVYCVRLHFLAAESGSTGINRYQY
jgi:hypothetical protein